MVMNFCEKCGTKREENAKFCMKCGCKFPDEHIIEEKKDDNAQEEIVPDATEPSEDNTEAPENANAQENTPAQVFVPLQTQMQMPLQTEPMSEPLKPMKKASYKGEIILLIVSVICFICSLCFFLVMKTTMFDSIGFVQKLKGSDVSYATDESPEIPELTVEMAEEIINNATDFPYYYFEKNNMFNRNDYILYPGVDFEVKCYAVDGIKTKDDYFSYFEKYGTREFVEARLDMDPLYYIETETGIYFVPCEFTGRYPYSAPSLVLEKIDDETYLTYMWYEEPMIIKYMDGSFKVTTITVEEAIAPYIDKEATVTIPDLSGLSLEEAETELIKAGLTLDRNNITYLATDFLMEVNTVVGAKEFYKNVKPGASIGFYYVVEDPEFYRRGAKNEETIPTLTVDEAENILNVADNFSLMYFHDNDMIDENDIITVIQPDFGYECNAYSPIGIETEEDYFAFLKKYATSACTTGFYHSNYMIIDGKIYFHELDGVGDGGYGKDWLIVEKIDDATYFVFDTYYHREHIIIYVDGAFKLCVTEPDTVRELCNEAGATVEVPDISGMTIEEAERELNRVGLYLDRSNMSSVTANGWDGKVLIAKDYCKKVKPGSSVGVYLVKEFVYY